MRNQSDNNNLDIFVLANIFYTGTRNSVVECQLPKLDRRVQFPSGAFIFLLLEKAKLTGFKVN